MLFFVVMTAGSQQAGVKSHDSIMRVPRCMPGMRSSAAKSSNPA